MKRKMSDILNFDKLTAVKRIDSQEITSLHTSTFMPELLYKLSPEDSFMDSPQKKLDFTNLYCCNAQTN